MNSFIDITNEWTIIKIYTITYIPRRPSSSVGIATGYGLDGQGIESRCRPDFPHLSRPALGPTQPPVQWVPGLSWGKVRPGRDADPSPPSTAVVKKSTAIPLLLWTVRPVQSLSACTVQLYRYSPYGPYGLYRASVPVQYSYTSTLMDRTACTEPQCLYSTAIPLLLWTVRPVQSLNACRRMHFTFTLPYMNSFNTAVAQWLRCCAANHKVACSIPAAVIGIFCWRSPSDRTIALGSTQPLTEMSTSNISLG